jgi:hypothetical protein
LESGVLGSQQDIIETKSERDVVIQKRPDASSKYLCYFFWGIGFIIPRSGYLAQN